jgi:hypothetical protein
MLNASYQKLLTFQTEDGGFGMWAGEGSSGSNETALALMVLADMAGVKFVDPAVLVSAADYLAGVQGAQGEWGGLAPTAAVTWALHQAGIGGQPLAKASAWLQENALAGDPYGMAMAGNALAAMDKDDPVVAQIVEKLSQTAVVESDEAYWEAGETTLLHAYSSDAATTTTGLAAHLLLVTGLQQSLAAKAVRHLAGSKQAYGGWGSTESTAAALRALALAGAAAQGSVEITCNLAPAGELVIDSQNSDLLHLVDLDAYLSQEENTWSFAFTGTGELQYQFEGMYNTEWAQEPEPDEAFELVVMYDPLETTVGTPVTVTVVADNLTGVDQGMTLVGIPVPLGMAVRGTSVNQLKQAGVIQEWEVRGRNLLVYLDEFPFGATVEFFVELVPVYPVRTVAAPAFIYSYYNPAVRTETAPTEFIVD